MADLVSFGESMAMLSALCVGLLRDVRSLRLWIAVSESKDVHRCSASPGQIAESAGEMGVSTQTWCSA